MGTPQALSAHRRTCLTLHVPIRSNSQITAGEASVSPAKGLVPTPGKTPSKVNLVAVSLPSRCRKW